MSAATAETLDDDDRVTTIDAEDEEHRRQRGDFLPEPATEDEAATPEPESGEEAAAEGAQDAPAAPVDEEPKIPKSRLDEALMRARMAEAEAARLRESMEAAQRQTPEAAGSGAEAPPAYDFEQREKDYWKAHAEFDEETALKIRREIDAEKFKVMEQRAAESAARMLEQRLQQQEVNQMADAIVRELPFLAENDYDNEAARDFQMMRQGYQAQGMSLPQAMRAAAAKVAKLYPQAPPPEGTAAAAPNPQQQRDRQARERAALASHAQPPVTVAGVGNRAQPVKYDVEKMTEEEFAAMPEAEKRKLRGD